MSAARTTPRAGARRLVARAGPLAVAALFGACAVPPKPIAVAPEALPASPPTLAVWSPNAFFGTFGLPSLYFSTDRPGYASVFEVDRAGRVRVVFPRSPRDAGRVEPGRTYAALGTGLSGEREFLTPATNWARLPFLFVVVSDARLDLSDFGTGREWRRQVRVDGVQAEAVIAAVGDRVTAGSGRPYTTEFAYVAPRLSPREAYFAAQCGRQVLDRKDYWYFRDLWAVFTPADPTLGLTPVFAFGPVVTWSAAPYLTLAYDRAQLAVNAFTGSCGVPFDPAYRSPLFYALYRPGSPVVPYPVAVVPTPPTNTPPRLTPPPGAEPRTPRLPRTPKEVLDDQLRTGSRTSTGARLTPEPLTPERVTPAGGARRPGGVLIEPLDRPTEAMQRRWEHDGAPSSGAPSRGMSWGGGGSDGISDAMAARLEARARVRGEGEPNGGRRGLRPEPRGADARPVAPRDPTPPRAGGEVREPQQARPIERPVEQRPVEQRPVEQRPVEQRPVERPVERPVAPMAQPNSPKNEGGQPIQTP